MNHEREERYKFCHLFIKSSRNVCLVIDILYDEVKEAERFTLQRDRPWKIYHTAINIHSYRHV